jgi:hypothetical protein
MLGGALVALGITLAAGTAITSAQEAPQQAQPTGLPDLVMAPITDVTAQPYYDNHDRKKKRRWAVRFSTQVMNPGPGHFILHAHRAKVGTPCTSDLSAPNRCERGTMQSDQQILQPDGTTQTVPKVGVAYFDKSHFHWHLRAANQYELRTANGKRRLRKDNKTGFCFGDRIEHTQGATEYPGLEDGLATCLYGSVSSVEQDGRRALEMLQGISAGYGDDYPSFKGGNPLQGQQLEVTGLKAGRYLLVNKTNATRKYREVTAKNNASSVLFKLSWPKGKKKKPRIKVLRSCASKASCARRA